MKKNNLVQYYAQRAQEYEKIYAKPERQEDLARIADWLQAELAHKEILEIACGTGYWTQYISRTAQSVLATDINPEVLAIAESKPYPRKNVRCARHDMDALLEIPGSFNALFAGFLWSHIPLQDLDAFIEKINRRMTAGSKVVLIDNLYVPGSSSPITSRDEFGNTYQERVLADGSKHLILKNFPSSDFMHAKLDGIADDLQLIHLDYYWLLRYYTRC